MDVAEPEHRRLVAVPAAGKPGQQIVSLFFRVVHSLSWRRTCSGFPGSGVGHRDLEIVAESLFKVEDILKVFPAIVV